MASRADLVAAGHSDAEIRSAVRLGQLRRIRRGWYCSPETHPDVVRAVAAGGRVGCQSALQLRGVWVLADTHLHVIVDHGAHRRNRPSVRLHWRMPGSPIRSDTAVDTVRDAIEQLSRCASPIATVIALDSALNLRLIRPSEIAQMMGSTRRARWILERVDGRRQSGTETIVDVALRGRGIHLRPQVEIGGVGRVDMLVGDRLVIEVDSRAWHDTDDQYEVDRRRDSALVARGYLVIRITYKRLMEDWAGVEREILAVIRRGEHRWTATQRRKLG